MIVVNDRPCNGVDLSHWNGDFTIAKDWLRFFGHKATDPRAGVGMPNGIDEKFDARRAFVEELGVRWRAYYAWVIPTTQVSAVAQVALLCDAVGDLNEGDSVYLDWEDRGVTHAMIEEISYFMDIEFTGRWFMYVNDTGPEMTSWMESNLQDPRVPIMHPNYNLQLGLNEAKKWNAMIWQSGTGRPPGFTTDVPIDYVLQPQLLDWVCGRS